MAAATPDTSRIKKKFKCAVELKTPFPSGLDRRYLHSYGEIQALLLYVRFGIVVFFSLFIFILFHEDISIALFLIDFEIEFQSFINVNHRNLYKVQSQCYT